MHSRLLFVSVLLVSSLAASARAEEEGDGDAMGLGFGAQALLTQQRIPASASVSYDWGTFHLDALFGLSTLDDTAFLGGARFYYTVNRTATSDLSLGAGAGIESIDPADEAIADIRVYHLELSAKIRAFVVPNVALSATLGAGALAGDGDGFVLTGQFIGTLGVTYFLQ